MCWWKHISCCDGRRGKKLSNIIASTEMPNLDRGRNKGFSGTDFPHPVDCVAREDDLYSGQDRWGLMMAAWVLTGVSFSKSLEGLPGYLRWGETGYLSWCPLCFHFYETLQAMLSFVCTTKSWLLSEHLQGVSRAALTNSINGLRIKVCFLCSKER